MLSRRLTVARTNTKGLMVLGIGIIVFMLLIAIFADLISQHDPNEMSLRNRFETPSVEHIMGRDQNGSDIFSKLALGARVSLGVALSVVFISCLIGLILGSLSGYFGGWIDGTIMRIIDMFLAFPNFLLALGIIAVMGASIRNLIIAMCVTGWTGYARLARGEILRLKQQEFIQSALALGNSPLRVVVLHMWPNLAGPLLVNSTFAMAGTIISESGLSFLGLGAPPTTPTWGALLSAGRKYLFEAPHMSIFPGLAIMFLVLGFNLFGDALRDYLDPRTKSTS